MKTIDNQALMRAISYLYKHIDQPMMLEDIAEHAHVSVATLKRYFQEAFNKSVGSFIRGIRMELALRSLQNRDESILEIALSAGFNDHSAFSRSFKQTFGYAPSSGREKLNIISELDHIQLQEPDFALLEDFTIQGISKTGTYFDCAPRAWQTLQELLLPEEINDNSSSLFVGIGHNNPHHEEIGIDQVKFTAGIHLIERNLNIDKTLINGGHYARFRYYGKPINLGLAYHYIFGPWQDKSATKINHERPAFIVFEHFPNALQEQNIMIHVPLVTID